MEFRVLVADPIAPEGVELLRKYSQVDVRTGLSEPDLIQAIPQYDALVVRSETKVTSRIIEAGDRLQVIARAGIGVDNIDVDAATKRGILVVNAPLGNTVAAAEHAIALILSLARNIPQADASIRRGEWQRSKFMGVELAGKTLGIVGLGKVGAEVARRARSFNMNLLAYDPYVSASIAESLGARLVSLDELLRNSDIVTVHVPLLPSTRNLISSSEFDIMKPDALLVNVARGGVVNEEALVEALKEGKIAGAALDVYEKEPLPPDSPIIHLEHTVLTPHLGASTKEAQVKVALEVAEQVIDVLNGRPARGAVNAPSLPPELLAGELGHYIELADKLGRLYTQVHGFSHTGIEIVYCGDLASQDHRLIRSAVLRGLLEPISSERISFVNAEIMAQERGLRVTEATGMAPEGYTSSLRLQSAEGVLEGTVIGEEQRVIRLDKFPVDFIPSGYFLFCPHIDRPGVIGAIGTILGNHNINISAAMSGRLAPRGETMLVLTLDEPVPDEVCEEIRQKVPGIGNLTRASL